MSPIHAKLTHMGIHVRDLDRMVGFYSEVLGLMVADRGPGRSPRQRTGVHDRRSALPSPGGAGDRPSGHRRLQPDQPGLVHRRRARRAARSPRPRPDPGRTDMRCVSHGNAWSIYFRDPEGNTLEAYLDTPFHVPQPYGEALDLDKPDETILHETEAACRAAPGFMPREDYMRQVAARLS